MDESANRLTVILPVFNGERFIAKTLEALYSFLVAKFQSFEIVVIDDGSTDGTGQTLAAAVERNGWGGRVRVESFSGNRGKFAAIGAGVKVASGSCVIFTDADLPYDLEAICYLEQLINKRGYHLAIGDRALPGSEYREHLVPSRRIATQLFSHAVRLLVTGGLYDTQCGLKAFHVDVARELFGLLTDNRFAADVELLYVALKYNLEIRRVPVRLRRQAPSTVRTLPDGLQMLATICCLKLNWIRGRYNSPKLFEIGKQYYWNS